MKIYAPYEYSTEKEAKIKMDEIAESEETWGVVKNANGSYSIQTVDDGRYDYTAWSGSIFIRKDAMVHSASYDLPLMAACKRESDARLYCAIASVDEDGYVTDLRRSAWN